MEYSTEPQSGEGSPLDAAAPPNGGAINTIPFGKRPEGTYAAVTRL